MEQSQPVFVYGTLRRGGSNHFRMDGCTFVASASVAARLYRIDWYPGLLLDSSANPVLGDVFLVPPCRMEELDAFEGPEYQRVPTRVILDDGTSADAWLWEWLGPVDESRRIDDGDWLGAAPDANQPQLS